MRLKTLTTASLIASVLACAGTVHGVISPAEWDRRKLVAPPKDEALAPQESSDQCAERGHGPADPEADLRILKPRPVPKVPPAIRPQPKPQPPPRPTPVKPGSSATPSPSAPAPTPPITRPT